MKRKLFLLLCALLTIIGAKAQVDVTDTYITNPGFEDCVAETVDKTTGTNVDYASSGWTSTSNGANSCGAVVAYGGVNVNGKAAPSADNAGNPGNALGISVGWTQTVTYKSANVTLPAGYYILSANVYNNNDEGFIFNSKLGFITSSTSYLSTSPSYPFGTWVKDEVAFYLSEDTEGYFQIGGTAQNTTSSTNAKAFFDNLTLIRSDKQMDYTSSVSKTAWKKGNGSDSGTTTGNGIGLRENYSDAAVGTKLYQEVSGLKNGFYSVVLYATSHNARGEGGATLDGTRDDVAYVFATSSAVTKKTYFRASGVTPGFLNNEPLQCTINDIEVKDGTITLGLGLDVANITGWHTIQIKSLTRTADLDLSGLIAAYEAALSAAKDINQESAMAASVLTALQSAISTYDEGKVDDQDAEALETATTALSNATTVANESISNYEAALTILNAASSFDAAGRASYAANETVAAIQSAYDARTLTAVTSEQESSCEAALRTAALAQTTENSDMTLAIVNPSFETNNFSGWTNNGMATQGNNSFTLKNGSYYAEVWQPNGTKGVSQTLSAMPSGVYRLSAASFVRGITSAKIFAGDVEKAITVGADAATYSVEFACDNNANVEIGFEAVCTGAGASWICVDNFTLTLVSSGLPDVVPVVGKMNATVATAQTEAIETYEADRTIANYNAASAAIAAAQASVDAYATGKTALDKVDAILANTNVYTAEAYTTFGEAKLAAQNGYDNGTWTNEEATSYGSTVFGTGWRTNATIDDFLISAWDAAPRDWSTYHINTWSTTGDSGNPNMYTPCFEYWAADNTTLADKLMTATLGGFDPGATYKVAMTVCAGVNTGVAASTAPTGVTLQLNDGSAVSVCTGDRIAETRFYEGTFEANATVGVDGNLVIKLNVDGTNASWITWRDVKYTKTGDAPANWSANLTVSNGKLGTFIAPFVITLPAGVKAYSATATETEVKLTKIAEGGEELAAGTPVIVYGDGVSVDETFYGVPTVTENQTVGALTGILDDSNKTISSGKYVLQTQSDVQAFYKLASNATGKLNRCFVSAAEVAEARLVISIDEEDPTAINAIEAANAKAGALKDGKYLIGNKVVLVKNGVKYGANGQILK